MAEWCHPTGKRIRRDGWLSPLTRSKTTHSVDPEVHTQGVRSSDRGFLEIGWSDHKQLLAWTATQPVAGQVVERPRRLAQTLSEIGIDASMWRDLVWDWQKYFGKTSCVGRPESMKADAERNGHRHHRGQAKASACFA